MTREEAIQVLKEISTTLKSWSGFTSYPQAIDMAIEALSAEAVPFDVQLQSTREVINRFAENRVKVVRCKDCKNYEDGMVGWCWETDRGVAEDFFCAYGERREP